MFVRPRCVQCTNRASWKVHLYIHDPGEARQMDMCGCHVKPFRQRRLTAAWTVVDLTRVVYS